MIFVMIKKTWHRRTKHLNYQNLNQLLKLIDGVEFVHKDDRKKHFFCESCILNKKHKFHFKQKSISRFKTSEKRFHADIFDEGNILSDIKNLRYDAVIVNDVTRMKFSLILKTKNEIVPILIKIINLIETQTSVTAG